jgi:hypothetical protein
VDHFGLDAVDSCRNRERSLVATPRLIHTMFSETGRITHVAGQAHRSPGGIGNRRRRSTSL